MSTLAVTCKAHVRISESGAEHERLRAERNVASLNRRGKSARSHARAAGLLISLLAPR